MRKILLLTITISFFYNAGAQQCRFEKTNGLESATYFEAIDWYKNLDKTSTKVMVKEMGMSDAGYPLQLVLVSNDGRFDAAQWHKQNKAVILINNGIHPGEPDGIDASMMLVRDIVNNKIKLPDNVAARVGQYDEVAAADSVVVNPIRRQEVGGDREGFSRRLSEAQREHLGFVRQARIELRYREHQPIGVEVIPVSGALGVIALVSGVKR